MEVEIVPRSSFVDGPAAIDALAKAMHRSPAAAAPTARLMRDIIVINLNTVTVKISAKKHRSDVARERIFDPLDAPVPGARECLDSSCAYPNTAAPSEYLPSTLIDTFCVDFDQYIYPASADTEERLSSPVNGSAFESYNSDSDSYPIDNQHVKSEDAVSPSGDSCFVRSSIPTREQKSDDEETPAYTQDTRVLSPMPQKPIIIPGLLAMPPSAAPVIRRVKRPRSRTPEGTTRQTRHGLESKKRKTYVERDGVMLPRWKRPTLHPVEFLVSGYNFRFSYEFDPNPANSFPFGYGLRRSIKNAGLVPGRNCAAMTQMMHQMLPSFWAEEFIKINVRTTCVDAPTSYALGYHTTDVPSTPLNPNLCIRILRILYDGTRTLQIVTEKDVMRLISYRQLEFSSLVPGIGNVARMTSLIRHWITDLQRYLEFIDYMGSIEQYVAGLILTNSIREKQCDVFFCDHESSLHVGLSSPCFYTHLKHRLDKLEVVSITRARRTNCLVKRSNRDPDPLSPIAVLE